MRHMKQVNRLHVFDIDLRIHVIKNVAQRPLHHVTDATAKFEVATSHDLEGDAFTRNVADDWTHGLALVRK